MKIEVVKIYDKIELTDEEKKFLENLVEVAKNVVEFKKNHGYCCETVERFLGDFVVTLSECGECNMDEYY